ncbi:barstar family protein [Dechloromonas sp. XY25]|uniref:Barstar family protein n=1 Tax=Dechloromonas hankyongensis TaxID=2908002 RepID=A0ABS9K5L3_9RHOO|nr:barstar family protein [Dechloromonas hankyongensis]MCG2578443.1 barstar family protein [Dechloromonas hankyongensis]
MGDHVFSKIDTSGVYSVAPERRAVAETAAAKEHLHLLKASIPSQANKEQALVQLGADLDFPSWYGANFDALFDCLTDPDWCPAKGHVILITGMGELRTSDQEAFTTLIDVFQAAAESRQEAGSPFWILLDSPARGIAVLPKA